MMTAPWALVLQSFIEAGKLVYSSDAHLPVHVKLRNTIELGFSGDLAFCHAGLCSLSSNIASIMKGLVCTYCYCLGALVLFCCGESTVEEKRTALEKSKSFTEKAMAAARKDSRLVYTPQALALVDSALAYEPANRKALDVKVILLRSKQDFEAALRTLEHTHTLYPNDALVTLQLAMEKELQGDSTGAKQLYQASEQQLAAMLDTLSMSQTNLRNTYEMNLALAQILNRSDTASAYQSQITQSIHAQLGSIPRKDLLLMRRK